MIISWICEHNYFLQVKIAWSKGIALVRVMEIGRYIIMNKKSISCWLINYRLTGDSISLVLVQFSLLLLTKCNDKTKIPVFYVANAFVHPLHTALSVLELLDSWPGWIVGKNAKTGYTQNS